MQPILNEGSITTCPRDNPTVPALMHQAFSILWTLVLSLPLIHYRKEDGRSGLLGTYSVPYTSSWRAI